MGNCVNLPDGLFAAPQITLFMSLTDHAIPKPKSVIWFPFVQTHKPLLSSTQSPIRFFPLLSIVSPTKLFIPRLSILYMLPNIDMSQLPVLP